MNYPTGEGGAISADRAALEAASDAFADEAQRFDNTVEPLGRFHDQLCAGAGELRSGVETGSSQFLLGWHETVQVCGETAGIIAGNIGGYWVDLSAVDVDTTITIDIRPTGS